MQTETMNKLFLELSQFTSAKTAKEIELENKLEFIRQVARGERQVADDDTGGLKFIAEYIDKQ